MQRVTIRLEESLLAQARERAAAEGKSLDKFVSDFISREIGEMLGARTRAMLELADRLGLKSEDGPMSREEAHERAVLSQEQCSP